MSPEHPILELLTPPRSYTVSDLLHWADFSGELDPHWGEFVLACQRQAAARELNADKDQLQNMSEEFRYRYDITTTEETEKWLEHRGVDLNSFTDWLERRCSPAVPVGGSGFIPATPILKKRMRPSHR